jgi:opacity protein-like surface antigen
LDKSDSSYSAKDNPYTVGPSIELKLPRGFGIEFDALYRHASYHSSFVGFGGSSYGIVAEEQKVRVNTWTFPVMAKYRLPLRGFQPYVAGGMAFRRIQADVNSLAGNKGLFETQFSFHSFSYDAPSELKHRSPLGGVIGVGLDFGFRHLRFSPEIRYTGWSSRSFESGASQFFVRSKQSETTVLFGVMF